MARKDVELVISASDQTSATVTAITRALNGLIKTEGSLDKSTQGAGGALLGLAKSVNDLGKALRGMTAAEKLAKEMDRATKALDSQNAALVQNATEQERNQKAIAETAARAAALRQEMAALETSLKGQQTALKGQRDGHAALNAELAKATASRDRAASAEGKLTDKIEQQQVKIGEAQSKYDGYAAAVAAAEKPTKLLVDRFEASAKAVDRQKASLAGLEAQLAASRNEFATAGAEVTRLAGEIERSSAAITDQKGAIAGSKSSLSSYKTEVREVVAAEKELSQVSRTLDSNQAGLTDGLARSEASMEELKVAAKQAEDALDKLAAKSRGPLLQAFRQQADAIGKLRTSWKENEVNAKALSEEIGRVGVPTKAMAEAFDLARAAARQSKDEMIQQTAVLQTLRNELRGSKGDVDGLGDRQQAFAQALRGSDAALAQVAAASKSAGAAMEKLRAESAGAAGEQGRVAGGLRQTGGAASQAAGATDKLSQAYRKLYGESRQAMSWTQRLRGEVLSLISAYGGVYGVIQILQQTVTAYRNLEAAASRLNAVFDGNQSQVASELDFIRRNANRLGIEFGQLAEEYTKFAAATKNTNLQGAETRRIFVSVAEAARVNNLSLEETQGVFRALTQIVSKGKVQLEELTGQLGDRLPGALQIMADGLGVTTEELLDMTKNGEVTSDALSGFADELDRRFGPSLAKSLSGTTTLLGQLQNAVTQLLIAFGNAGFIEGFNELLRSLTETLKSADFITFAQNVSVAFGAFAKALAFAASNFQLLTVAALAFAGVKLVPIVQALAASFLGFARNLQMTASFTRVVNTQVASMAGPVGGATRAFIGLRAAMSAALSSTGIGLAITAIATLIGYWITEANSATEAIQRHISIVDKAKDAYERAGGQVDKWRKSFNDFGSESELKDAIQEADDIVKDSFLNKGFLVGRGDSLTGLDKVKVQFSLLAKEVYNGSKTLGDYRKALDDVIKSDVDERIKSFARARLADATAAQEQIERLAELKKILESLNVTEEDAKKIMDGVTGVVKEHADAFKSATDSVGDYEKAILKLKEGLPQFAEELKKLKAEMDIKDAIKGLSFNQITPEILGLIGAQRDQASFGDTIKSLAGFTDGLDAATKLIADREGKILSAKYDVNAYRVGYGSDTITDSNNRVSRVTKSTRITEADALRDLTRRTAEFMAAARNAVGADRFAQLNPGQQAALTSIGYNYGAGEFRPGGDLAKIVEEVKFGTKESVAAAFRARAGDNEGVNRNRRNEEAAIYSNGDAEATNAERTLKAEKEKALTRKEFSADVQRDLEAAREDLSLKDQDIVKREQAKAIREREAELAKEGLTLGDAERQKILETVELRYREQANLDSKNAKLEKARAAEEELNRLLEQRSALEDRAKLYDEMGETDKAAEARTQITGMSTAIQEATQNAIAMWQAVGGTEAATAIESLKTAQVEAQKFAQAGQKSLIDWQQVGDLFANGLVSAFDDFAQAVANGESIGEAAKNAFMKFAAQFLIDIGKMIVKQIVFNAVSSLMKSFGLGGLGGASGGAGLFHSGGRVGSIRGAQRQVPMAMFANAPRFHEGNSGLGPNEYPAILEKNERVLTESQDKAVQQQLSAGSSASPVNLRVINTFNSEEVVQEGLNTPAGEEAILNIVRKNKGNLGEVLRG